MHIAQHSRTGFRLEAARAAAGAIPRGISLFLCLLLLPSASGGQANVPASEEPEGVRSLGVGHAGEGRLAGVQGHVYGLVLSNGQFLRLRVAGSVVFTGGRDDVPAIIAALDVAVLPSYREAQGVSLLEAMALAKPVVASRVGGIPEFVEDGVTGLLVDPRDPSALAGAITRTLRDRALAGSLGENGRALVRERYCVDEMVRRIEGVYEEGIAAREALAAVQRRSA